VMLGGPANCCGVQHARRDDAETGRKLAWNTFDKFDAFAPERLLFWCPSCDHRLNGMGDDQSELATQRQHVTEFFVEHLDRFHFKPLPRPMRVALHAHTGTPQQGLDARATRRLLEAIPGIEIVDLPAVSELGARAAHRAAWFLARTRRTCRVSAVRDAVGARRNPTNRRQVSSRRIYSSAATAWISMSASGAASWLMPISALAGNSRPRISPRSRTNSSP